jgi:hypothetical protein
MRNLDDVFNVAARQTAPTQFQREGELEIVHIMLFRLGIAVPQTPDILVVERK